MSTGDPHRALFQVDACWAGTSGNAEAHSLRSLFPAF